MKKLNNIHPGEILENEFLQHAAVGQGNITMNSGNSIADLYTQQGNARAAGIVGGSNAVMQGRQSLLNLAGGFIGAGAGAAGAGAGAAIKNKPKSDCS